MSGYKRCRVCGEEKPRGQFAMPHGRPSSLCRDCYRAAIQAPSWASASSSDRSPRVRTRGSEASGDTYELWQDLQWKTKIAAASLAERGRHELALEKKKELRKQKRKDRWAIVKYLAINLDRAVVRPAEKYVLAALAAPFLLIGWIWKQLFG